MSRMLRAAGALSFLLLAAACGPAITIPAPAHQSPNPVPTQQPGLVTFDTVTCAVVPHGDHCDMPIEGVTVKVHTCAPPTCATDTYDIKTSDPNGYNVWVEPDSLKNSDITFEKAGYLPQTVGVLVSDLVGQHNVFQLYSPDVDPTTFSLEQLAAVRGAMWTTRINVPYGPRPGQDSNILATDFYELYDAPTRARMLDKYQGQGYTHAVTGPVAGSDCYHWLYPCRTELPTQAQWDAYLDTIQEWWNRGLVPVYFHKPDGWEASWHAADLDALDALAMQPRAQRLLRVVVYPGWEPSGDKYGWKNSTYVAMVQRGARVFPNALRALHTVSDLDAPTGGDDDRVFPACCGNAISWSNVVPYIHLWLVQVGGYVGENVEIPSDHFVTEFKKLWPDFRRKFNGADGWPSFSAWGPGQPVRACYAEGASYRNFWNNFSEKYALDLGDIAMTSGAWCYLDGGRLPVPVRQ